jgi:hypothetical protein
LAHVTACAPGDDTTVANSAIAAIIEYFIAFCL